MPGRSLFCELAVAPADVAAAHEALGRLGVFVRDDNPELETAGERIIIVCHGGVINAYTGHIIRTDVDMFFRPAHASVSIVVAGEGRRVVRLLNDTHHLSTAEGDFATY